MRREEEKEKQGGMWTRGEIIGRGNVGTVSLAKTKRRSYLPSVMAVKSVEVSQSYTLQKEKEIFTILGGCPHILRSYGEEITTEKGELIYNVLFEYASGGNLAAKIKNSGGGLPESEVRRYTRSILRGLNHIHERGYVHCDIKPENILLVPCASSSKRSGCDYVAKIGDFVCAKKTQQKQSKNKVKRSCSCLRGSPLYMSPETVSGKEQEPPSDIWALGCVVAEMISGKPVWNCKPGTNVDDLLSRIGSSRKFPGTPIGMSKEGKDFLIRCLFRTGSLRWTAAMLLRHPFVALDDEDDQEAEDVLNAPEEIIEKKFLLIRRSFVEEATVGDLKRRRITSSNNSTTPLTMMHSAGVV